MSFRCTTLIPFIAIGLLGCETESEGIDEALPESGTGATASPWEGTVTFAGTLPCASCPGIETTLQLKEDGTYFARSVYLEADEGEDGLNNDIGHWRITADGEMLVLRGGTEGGLRWRLVGTDTLVMLTNLGEPIASDLPYNIVRTDDSQHLTGDLRMSGMYQYMADAAVYQDCRTRKRYPVVLEEAHIDLERAYMNAAVQAGQPLLASFDGRIELRPRMDGEGEQETIVVSQFDGVSPESFCTETTPQLTNTIWRLIELNGYPVSSSDEATAPHLVLVQEDSVVAGSGGCNRFTGQFSMPGGGLRFGNLASTMMACEETLDQETAFMQSLSLVTGYDHYGDKLELLVDGRFLARFEAANIE